MKLHHIFFCLLLTLFFVTACENDGTEPVETETPTAREPVSPQKSAKRGFCFSSSIPGDFTLLSQGSSWAYNWGVSVSGTVDTELTAQNIEYVPMAWSGINANALRTYVASHPNCKYLLGFNEPNLTDQANMTPAVAASKWSAVIDIAKELNLKVLAPALNYGTLAGYSDPVKWLDEFLQQPNVSLDDIHGIALHCYMPAANSVKTFIDRFRKYNKPVWLTEFCSWDSPNPSSAEAQINYMIETLNYLESDPIVERYAWFMARGTAPDKYPYYGLLVQGSASLSMQGIIFNNLSSFDQNCYYVEDQVIEAENYSAVSSSENVGEENTTWVKSPILQWTTDLTGGNLELYYFMTNQWVEYNIDLIADYQYDLQLRYSPLMKSEANVLIDGETVLTVDLPRLEAGQQWATTSNKIELKKGKHTLRIAVTKGGINMNWLKLAL